MTAAISKSQDEIREMPLVELACEILKAKREPYYFRDLMAEIKQLRSMSEEEVMDVIARLYTEINIDGRFICIGQNVWGLKRWYPVDKVADRAPAGKKFVRSSGDAFSDDEEDLEDYEEPEDELDESDDILLGTDDDSDFEDEDADADAEVDDDVEEDDEDLDYDEDSDEDSDDDELELVEEDADDEEEED